MMALPGNGLLKFNDNVKEKIRSKYNYNEESMKEAIHILQEWIKQQPHFRKKDFPPGYLENCLIGRKGSMERTKSMLDKLCTMRTLMPQFFMNLTSQEFDELFQYVRPGFLLKPTKDNYRVFMAKVLRSNITQQTYINFCRYAVMICEYVRMNDYSDGFFEVLDLTDLNLLELTMSADVVVTKQIPSILLEGFGMRLIGFHLISESTLVSSIVSIVKMILGEKLGKRIFVHKNLSDLHEHVDRKILPKEYDGEECSLQELSDIWVKELLSERNMNHLIEMKKATTDETYRNVDKFNEEYAGVPGTFRALHLD